MKLYNDYNTYLRNKYGCKVHKISLDGNFTCPNRDGTKGVGGCIYCDVNGSLASYTNASESIKEQLEHRIAYLKKERGASKFIAYFQAFTNTYADLNKLKTAYDSIMQFEDIVGLAIGTRPDAIDEEKMRLISSYKDRYEVSIELGLQSSHDRTLEYLNRLHTYSDFVDAVRLAKKYGIFVAAHVILGLPDESRLDMLETAKRLNGLKIDGVKIHLLHVLKGSKLEKLYVEGSIKMLEKDEYIDLVCDFLEHLSQDVVIQRLTGEGRASSHIAPLWALNKSDIIEKIGETLKARGTCQGFKS